jgi:HEPN domain-containing protein
MNGKEFESSRYWWAQSDARFRDALVLLNGNGTKEGALNNFHGAIERQLKGVLVQRTSKVRRVHELSELVELAKLESELPIEIGEFLRAASGLHCAAYPRKEVLAKWTNEQGFKDFLLNVQKTTLYLNGYR